MSTWTLLSASYLWMPPAAIFQNWLGLLVTNASLTIFAAPPPPRLQPIAAAIAIAIMTSEKPNLDNVVFITTGLLVSPRAGGILTNCIEPVTHRPRAS